VDLEDASYLGDYRLPDGTRVVVYLRPAHRVVVDGLGGGAHEWSVSDSDTVGDLKDHSYRAIKADARDFDLCVRGSEGAAPASQRIVQAKGIHFVVVVPVAVSSELEAAEGRVRVTLGRRPTAEEALCAACASLGHGIEDSAWAGDVAANPRRA